MENIIINPKDYEQEYITRLNLCYKDWGAREEYAWQFNRTVGDKTTDIIIIENENNQAVAGSAVIYRKLKSENDTVNIGIMTASWTLPEARGQGHFSKIIEVSREVCNKKDVPFLTAFVMETNASYRRLKEAGSILVPSYSHFSPEVPYVNTDHVSITTEMNESHIGNEIYKRINRTNDYMTFDYTADEFLEQYINRGKNAEILKLDNDYVIIEETTDVIKILLITYDNLSVLETNVRSLANWGLKYKNKKLLMFSTRIEVTEVLSNLDFEKLPGYFTILNSTEGSISSNDIFTNININMGDKM